MKSPMTKFTLKSFQAMFPNDNACLDYLRNEWFPEVIKCENCGREAKFYRITTRKVYGCEFCGYQISPTAGTIFHKSPTPLTTWFYVIYLMAQTRGGISAKQIQRETGVTYKCAWRMCKRVRSMLFEDSNEFSGKVELDESYFGGKHAGTWGARQNGCLWHDRTQRQSGSPDGQERAPHYHSPDCGGKYIEGRAGLCR